MNRLLLLLSLAGLVAGCAAIPPEEVKPFEDYADWLLLGPLRYQIGDTEFEVVVPAGFVTDYASIPRALCHVLPKHGRHSRSAIVHDYLYWKQECTRGQADKIMYLAMAESGVDPTTRYTMYKALERFGEAAFVSNKNDRDDHLPRLIPLDSEYMADPTKGVWPEYRKYLRQQKVPLDERGPAPTYCAAADRLYKQARSTRPSWWQFWKWGR